MKKLAKLIPMIPVIIGASIVMYYIPVWYTEKLLKVEARSMCRHNVPGDATDFWDNKIRYTSTVLGDDMVLRCHAISAGRDGRFETDDDIEKMSFNINKSKMAGVWAGQKFRQAAKGFVGSSKKEWLE